MRDVKSPHLTRCFHWLSIYGDTEPQTVHFNMENVEGWTIPAGDNLVDHGSDFLSANDLNSVALDDIDGKSSNCIMMYHVCHVSCHNPKHTDQVYIFPRCNCTYILFLYHCITQGLR